MPAQTGYATVANPINISGLLYNKTNVDTPLFNMIGSRTTQSRVFLTGATFDTGYPSAATPGISEEASRTAPNSEFWERENAYNVTQIFHRAVEVTYRKESNAADLNAYDGTNMYGPDGQPVIQGNTNNVPGEFAWQLANATDKLRLDLEYTLINGTFQDSKGVAATADQTRGLLAAITENEVTAGNQELSFEMIYDAVQKLLMAGTPYGLESYICLLSYTHFKQLQKLVINEGLKISPSSAGANITEVITPFGILKFMPHRFMKDGTAALVCMPVLSGVAQPVPGKGNFFYEPLAKVGASEKGQVYGQWGLDHGPEFLHGKITGIKTTVDPFTAPQVYVVNGAAAANVMTASAKTTTTKASE